MKTLTTLVCLLFTLQSFATEFDSQALSSALNSTLDIVVEDFDYLSDAEITIDPTYTNPDLGRINVAFEATTVPLTSNAGESILISGFIHTDIQDTDDQRKSFDLKGELKLEGHTLLILKNVAKSFGECKIVPVDDITDDSDHVNNILCTVLDGVRVAQKVPELEKSLQSAANYAKKVYGEGEEGKAKSILTQVFSTLKIIPSETDLLLTIGLDIEKFKAKGSADLKITERGLFLTFEGQAIFEDRELEEYISLVKDTAVKLQDKESETHLAFEDSVYTIVGFLDAFVNDSNEEDDGF